MFVQYTIKNVFDPFHVMKSKATIARPVPFNDVLSRRLVHLLVHLSFACLGAFLHAV